MRSTSSGACHGSKGLVRSTPVWLNQLFADEISRAGTFAPWVRANSPTAYPAFLSHGIVSAPLGNSPSLATYTKDGNRSRSSTVPGAVNCGIAMTSPEPSVKSRDERAQLVVPRSMPTLYRFTFLSQFYFGRRDDARIESVR